MIRAAALVALLLLGASEQQVQREWLVSHSPSPVELEELATVLRSVFDLREVNVNAAAATVRARGPVEMVTAADRTMRDLEEPEDIRARASHEFTIRGDKLPVVHLFYLPADSAQQHVQDVLTTVRTIVGLQKIFHLTPQQVLVMRGTDSDARLTAWLVKELEKPAPKGAGYTGIHQFHITESRNNTVRIFFAENPDNSDFAPVVKKIQATGQRAYFMPSCAALVVRGTADQIAADEWVIGVR